MLLGDWITNRRRMFASDGWPPAHLLRRVFEEAHDYGEARRLLAGTPVCVPCIFILCGVKPGEGCVIERTETAVQLRDIGTRDRITATNNFLCEHKDSRKGWRPRPVDCAGRQKLSGVLDVGALREFTQLPYPLLNEWSRLVVLASPAAATLQAQGFEKQAPVTAQTRF
jgi:hypothetical protein